MLSYKEYKLLNESLYGAFNLGLRSQGTVGGIVSASGVNGTEAALEAQAEEAIEEAKKAKKMKKKMDGDEVDSDEDEEDVKDEKPSEEDEGEEDEDSDDEDSEGDEDSDDDSDDEDEEDSDGEKAEKKDFAFMKKKMKCGSNKKSKKEWSDVMSDLEEVLEVIDDEDALTEVKKGLEMMKKGMEKGCGRMMDKKCCKHMSEGKNHHKPDCDCPICEKGKEKDDDKDGDSEGLSAAQKKLPDSLKKAILAKKGKKKGGDDKEDKDEKNDKKCGKNMKEDDAAWWQSVNSMLGTTDQKNWDGGWKEVGEVQQAVREHLDTPDLSAALKMRRDDSGKPGTDRPGDYGDTGRKDYPYHSKFLNDHYYSQKELSNADWEALSQEARHGISSLQRFLEARTMADGHTNYMKILDEFVGKLLHLGIYISGGLKVPYADSIHHPSFKRDR